MKLTHLLTAALLLASPSFAQDAEAPSVEGKSFQERMEEIMLRAAPPILRKTSEALKQPWDANISLNMEMEMATVEAGGTFSFFSPRLFSANMNFSIDVEGQEMDARIQAVADDDYLNVFIEASELPMPQAVKFDLDVMEELTGQGDNTTASLDMLGMGIEDLETMFSKIEFKESKLDDGATIRISYDLSAILETTGAQVGIDFDTMSIELDVNAKTSFIQKISVDLGDIGSGSCTFSNVSFPEEFDETKYVFEAPQGVPVMDVTGMLSAGMQESASLGGEEEF